MLKLQLATCEKESH